MNKMDAIKNGVDTLHSHGFALPESAKKLVADVETPVYRVAVIGKFQVGKSTLINKVFMGDNALLPSLSEGDGERAETAVATDVEYGETPKLEVYNWGDRGGEVLAVTKENPTAMDVKSATVADSEVHRSELATRVSRIRLVSTNESLRGYVILDTPGLDDPNKELLLNTTDRVIPSADLALVVVEPKQLDQIYDHLLREELIGHGVSKLMILVSYNPEKHKLDSEGRKGVVKTIEAQLEKFGRADVPVVMYCYDPAIDDENVVNTVPELRMTIRNFLSENALPGRLERVAFAVQQCLEDAEVETAVKIKSLTISGAERTALKEKVDKQIVEFKEQCEKSFRRLQNELDDLKGDMPTRVDLAVGGVFRAYIAKLESAPKIEDVRKLCDESEVQVLKEDLMMKVVGIQREVRLDVEKIVDRYTQSLTESIAKWDRFLMDDFGVERPLLAKIPPIVWTLIDSVIWDYFLPFGWLTGLFGAVIGKKIGIDSTIFLKPILVAQVKGAVEKSRSQTQEQIADQICGNVDDAFFQIKQGLETYNQGRIEKMRKSVVSDTEESDRKELEKTKSALSAALAALQ